MSIAKKPFAALAVIFVFCLPTGPDAISAETAPILVYDPNGTTPLAALVQLRTDEPTHIALSVSDGVESWAAVFPNRQNEHALPVLGLKANRAYTIGVVAFGADEPCLMGTLQMITAPLPEDFPEIQVLTTEPESMEPGFTVFDRFRRRRTEEPAGVYTIIVDAKGEVVWYSPLGGRATRRLANGNLLYFVDDTMVEQDLLGNATVTALQDPGLGLHHDLFPTADGTFLSLSRDTVSVPNFPTSETDETAPL